ADRQTPSGEAGARAARQKGHVQLVTDADDPRDLVSGRGEHDHVGSVLLDGEAIAFVDEQLARRRDEAVAADDCDQAVDEIGARRSFIHESAATRASLRPRFRAQFTTTSMRASHRSMRKTIIKPIIMAIRASTKPNGIVQSACAIARTG